MTIRDPQIATRHGALDSEAILDGGNYSAHHHRAIARNANLAASKGRLEGSAWWPLHDVARDGEGAGVWHFAGGHAPPSWAPVAGLTISKLSLQNRAEVRLTFRVTNAAEVDVQVATRARIFTSTPSDALAVTGTAAYEHLDFDDVPLAPGTAEDVALWVRARSRGDLLDTVAYGGPHTIVPPYQLEADRIAVATGSWVATGRTLTAAGHGVFFLDADGNTLAAREVVGQSGDNGAGGNDGLHFRPAFSPDEYGRVNRRLDRIEIRKLPEFDVSCMAIRTVEVTR